MTLACSAANGIVGVGYASSLSATGGVAPYKFAITAGALPGGLFLDTASGAITGTPVAPGVFSFTAKAVDSLVPGAGGSPDSATAACLIRITTPAPPPPPPPPPPTGAGCSIQDVQTLLQHVHVTSTSHIYATGPYVGGALMVEDSRDGAPPPVTLQVSSPGAPGSFCVYWIDDTLARDTPSTYHFPTVKLDHPVRFAWTSQGSSQFGVADANNTLTVHPYGGARPVPFVFVSDSIVGNVGVTFGMGDFAAEPAPSIKPLAAARLDRVETRQQPAPACLAQALVIDGGDKTSWVSSGIASGAQADGALMNTWLGGRGFTVRRVSQYAGTADPAYGNGTERADFLNDISAYVTRFTNTPTAANCHHEFFLYVSSHGSKADLVNGRLSRPSVFLYDSDGSGTNQSVSYRDIYDRLNAFPTDAAHRTTVYSMFDACYSGSAIPVARFRFTVMPTNPGHLGLQVICSSSASKQSASGHTLFSSSATEDFMKDSASITTGFAKMVNDLGAADPQRQRRPDRADATIFTLDP